MKRVLLFAITGLVAMGCAAESDPPANDMDQAEAEEAQPVPVVDTNVVTPTGFNTGKRLYKPTSFTTEP